ncbi:acetyltransferase [Paenibacillus rigui]|nr:acetyltransferase [Paenibacillus rigui]
MMPIVIVGSGGQGRETAQLIKDINRDHHKWDILGYIDERLEQQGRVLRGVRVLGGMNSVQEYVEMESCCFICAIGQPEIRRRVVEELNTKYPQIRYATLIHPTAVVADDQIIGEGTVLCAHTVITTDVHIGNHVLINYGSTIGHDTVIEDYVSILPGCHLSGSTHVSECVSLGTGTVVIQNVSIGRNTIVGAGAVVVKSLPDHCTAYGTPAKPMKARDPSE